MHNPHIQLNQFVLLRSKSGRDNSLELIKLTGWQPEYFIILVSSTVSSKCMLNVRIHLMKSTTQFNLPKEKMLFPNFENHLFFPISYTNP